MKAISARRVTTALTVVGALLTLWLTCAKRGDSSIGMAAAAPNPDAPEDQTFGAAASTAVPGAPTSPSGDDECVSAPDFYGCMMQRAKLTSDLIENLSALEGSKSPKAKEAALAAVKVQSPLVQEAALRVLGPFGADDAVAQAALPKLLGDVPAVQSAAADALGRNKRYMKMAYAYRSGHQEGTEFRVRPTDPTRWGFVAPPAYQAFPPGDRERTVAVRLKQSVKDASALYAKGAAQAFTASQFQAYVLAKSKESRPSQADTDAYLKAIGAAQKEYNRTKDPAALARMKELGDAWRKKNDELPKFDSDFYNVQTSAMSIPQGARIFVLERTGKADTKLAVIYDEPAIRETVVQLSWSASLGIPSRFRLY